MSSYSDQNIITLAIGLLRDNGFLSAREINSNRVFIEAISSDGSTRRFWRLSVADKPLCIIAAPLTKSDSEIKESRSAWYIGTHLYQKGCPVPEVIGWHQESGLLLFEDLGNERLHGLVVQSNTSAPDVPRVKDYYREVICKLVHMQVEGAVNFDSDWCWDGAHYDKDLMLGRESGYFLNAFWIDLLQLDPMEGIHGECEYLAEIAAEAPADYFLHRDFQSRNIMIAGDQPRFIDFQGGRFGPLGYDLASLLIDPYSDLTCSLQEEFEDAYIDEITKCVKLRPSSFRKEFDVLALQRNLQIIGAFSFLSRVRGKSFFADYLHPALQAAKYRLERPLFADMPLMKEMIDQGLKLI